ncbi:hypothetical protein DFH27DRAFT_343798 [Peziza echinospora]|nr:hypothetical protein DFH27DRAFT_343798 [Peziza echinospora]
MRVLIGSLLRKYGAVIGILDLLMTHFTRFSYSETITCYSRDSLDFSGFTTIRSYTEIYFCQNNMATVNTKNAGTQSTSKRIITRAMARDGPNLVNLESSIEATSKRPQRPEIIRTDTSLHPGIIDEIIREKMEKKMKQSFSEHDEEGSIYVYTPTKYKPKYYPDSVGPDRPFPRLGDSELPIKVGYSKNVEQRLKRHEKQCKYTTHKLYESPIKVKMQNFAERLIHLELQGRTFNHIKYYEPEKCRVCKAMHREFFVGTTYPGDGDMGLGKALAEVTAVIEFWVERVNCWALNEAKKPDVSPTELSPLILTSEEFRTEPALIDLVSDSEDASAEKAVGVQECRQIPPVYEFGRLGTDYQSSNSSSASFSTTSTDSDAPEYIPSSPYRSLGASNLSRKSINASIYTISTDSDASEDVPSSPYRSSMESEALSELEVEFAQPSSIWKDKGTMKPKEVVFPEREVKPLRRNARLLARQSKPGNVEVVGRRSSWNGVTLGASSSSTLPPPPPVRRASSIMSSIESGFSSINYFQKSGAGATKKGKGKEKASTLTTTPTAKSTTAPNLTSNPPIAASNECNDEGNFSPINYFQKSRENRMEKEGSTENTLSDTTASTSTSNPPTTTSNERNDNNLDEGNFSLINHFQKSRTRKNRMEKEGSTENTLSDTTASTASKAEKPIAPRQTPPQHQPKSSNARASTKINVVTNVQEALAASFLLPARAPLGAIPSNVIANDDKRARAVALERAMMMLRPLSLVIGRFSQPKPKKSNALNSGMAGGQENEVPLRAGLVQN